MGRKLGDAGMTLHEEIQLAACSSGEAGDGSVFEGVEMKLKDALKIVYDLAGQNALGGKDVIESGHDEKVARESKKQRLALEVVEELLDLL
jgi:hypothetical protein